MKSNITHRNTAQHQGLFYLVILFLALFILLPQNNVNALEDEDLVFVAGVLRYGSDSDDWDVIKDDSHTSLNIESVKSENNKIIIKYSFAAKKVISLVAIPDEIFMARGISLGTSVGLNSATIYIKQNQTIGGLVEYDEKNDEWKIPDRFFSVFEDGKLTLKHPTIGLGDLVSVDAGSELRVFIIRTGRNYIQLAWIDDEGSIIKEPINEMRAYITRTRDSSSYTNPSTLQISNGNIWG